MNLDKNELEIEILEKMIVEVSIQQDEAKAEITDIFSSIMEKSVLGNEFVVDNQSFWRFGDSYSINIKIKNSVYHWASEMVRSEIKIYEDKVESSFSNGSGGWNELPTKEVLDVFSSGLKMVKKAITIAEENRMELFELAEKRYKIDTKCSELYSKLSNVEKENKRKTTQKKADELLKNHIKVNNKTLIKELTEGDNDFRRIRLVRVDIFEESFRVNETAVSYENYGRKMFRLNDERISIKDLENFDFSNYYYKTLAQGYEFYGLYKNEK